MEESGYKVLVKDKICSAESYCVHPEIGCFHPIQTYYTGELLSRISIPIEKNHSFMWIEFSEAKGKMFADMQNWALEQLSEIMTLSFG